MKPRLRRWNECVGLKKTRNTHTHIHIHINKHLPSPSSVSWSFHPNSSFRSPCHRRERQPASLLPGKRTPLPADTWANLRESYGRASSLCLSNRGWIRWQRLHPSRLCSGREKIRRDREFTSFWFVGQRCSRNDSVQDRVASYAAPGQNISLTTSQHRLLFRSFKFILLTKSLNRNGPTRIKWNHRSRWQMNFRCYSFALWSAAVNTVLCCGWVSLLVADLHTEGRCCADSTCMKQKQCSSSDERAVKPDGRTPYCIRLCGFGIKVTKRNQLVFREDLQK